MKDFEGFVEVPGGRIWAQAAGQVTSVVLAHAGIAGARRIDVPGVAHLPNLERPEWFTETLLGFIAEAG